MATQPRRWKTSYDITIKKLLTEGTGFTLQELIDVYGVDVSTHTLQKRIVEIIAEMGIRVIGLYSKNAVIRKRMPLPPKVKKKPGRQRGSTNKPKVIPNGKKYMCRCDCGNDMTIWISVTATSKEDAVTKILRTAKKGGYEGVRKVLNVCTMTEYSQVRMKNKGTFTSSRGAYGGGGNTVPERMGKTRNLS
jgi:hypothetical protein